MPPEELLFEEMLSARMREKGLTPKRLSETTGIAPLHLENMLHGNFDHMPSTPYFRGYVLRLGKALDFNGEEWWGRLKRTGTAKLSGPADSLPQNRFIRKRVPVIVWFGIVIAVAILVYLAVALPRVTGKPSLTVSYPPSNPFTTGSSTITLGGMVTNADALYLSNGSASSSEEISVAPDGSWEKSVLLESGLNTFELSAKKLLGGETDVTEEIVYSAPITTGTSTATSPTPTPSPSL